MVGLAGIYGSFSNCNSRRIVTKGVKQSLGKEARACEVRRACYLYNIVHTSTLNLSKQVHIVAYSRSGIAEQIGIGNFKDRRVLTPWGSGFVGLAR